MLAGPPGPDPYGWTRDRVLLWDTIGSPGCGESGGRLWRSAEVDHRVPLFQVWAEHRNAPWPELLAYWGLPNLQVINRDAHVEKSAAEAFTRRRDVDAVEA